MKKLETPPQPKDALNPEHPDRSVTPPVASIQPFEVTAYFCDTGKQCDNEAVTPVVTGIGAEIDRLTSQAENSDAVTPVVTGIGAEIDRLTSQAENPDQTENSDSQDPEINKIRDMLEELFQSNLSQQQIFNFICEEMKKTDTEKTGLIWVTSVSCMKKIIRQAFKNTEKRLKEEELHEQQLISIPQYCWQKVISSEGKLFVLENMRALIQKTDDDNLKKKLFWALVVSIINSSREDENEDPLIRISDKMRENFPKALLTKEDTPEPYPKKISPTILLPLDKNYTETHEFLSSKKSSVEGNENIIAEVMLGILEQDFFTDEQWKEISLKRGKESYTAICKRFRQDVEEQILTKAEGPVIPSEEMRVAIVRAWNEIIYPRLLVWGEILYSDKLLLPKN